MSLDLSVYIEHGQHVTGDISINTKMNILDSELKSIRFIYFSFSSQHSHLILYFRHQPVLDTDSDFQVLALL